MYRCHNGHKNCYLHVSSGPLITISHVCTATQSHLTLQSPDYQLHLFPIIFIVTVNIHLPRKHKKFGVNGLVASQTMAGPSSHELSQPNHSENDIVSLLMTLCPEGYKTIVFTASVKTAVLTSTMCKQIVGTLCGRLGKRPQPMELASC